jgi:hypothetical protein
MRSSGVIDSTTGLGRHDHLCWAYTDRATFAGAARAFLADGVAIGQRVTYIGSRSTDALRHDLAGFAGMEELLASGAATVLRLDESYRVETESAQDEAYATATRDALDRGFTGLRVVADATDLVLDAAGRDAFIRYEHVIDRRMSAGLPFAAMCGYDRGRLGDDAVAELACVHPLHHGTTTPFHLFASGEGRLSIAGEVDALSASELERALLRVLSGTRPGTVDLDASRLVFADHRALLALDAAATTAGVAVHLAHPPPVLVRLVTLLRPRSVHLIDV